MRSLKMAFWKLYLEGKNKKDNFGVPCNEQKLDFLSIGEKSNAEIFAAVGCHLPALFYFWFDFLCCCAFLLRECYQMLSFLLKKVLLSLKIKIFSPFKKCC